MHRWVVLAMLCAGLGLAAATAGAAGVSQNLLAPTGSVEQFFGSSVDIDGDTAVVGAPGDTGYRGAVYVFTREGDTWNYSAKLVASDAADDDLLGSSVAIDGDTIVAGAPRDDHGMGDDQGALYTFSRTGTNPRTETAKLIAGDGATDDFMGGSVAIDGDTIVAGVPEIGASNKGAVYTFATTGANPRTQTAKITSSESDSNDRLGSSVAIDGDTIVAGAYTDDFGANADQGSVYTANRTGAATRNVTARLTASDGSPSDRLGGSVAIDGDTIVAGADFANPGGKDNAGAVYTFTSTGIANRTETAKLTASDGAASDELGSSVAIDGDTIVAGAIRTDDNRGSVYEFARTGASPRTEVGLLNAANRSSGDLLGRSVDLDGANVITGASLHDEGTTTDQGMATIFFDPTPDTTPPTVKLKAKAKQDAGKAIAVEVSCDEPCTADLSGTGKPKHGKRANLKPASDDLGAGVPETLKLKPSRKLKRALKRADAGKAKLRLVATDAAGNSSDAAERTVKLK